MAKQAAPRAAAALPLFYHRPVALQSQHHGIVSLRAQADYRFARDTNAIPLTTAEFFRAQRDYPIVFTDERLPMPVAVVGIREAANLFVETDGGWRTGTYVPAHVRRYPFLLARQPAGGDFVLCVDAASDLLEIGGGNPLFKDGKPTAAMQKPLELCLAYERQIEQTREFMRALLQVEFLTPRDARVQLAPGEAVQVAGFKMIDEEKFNQLPAETFREWRQKGWIALIYAHLLSLGAWERLARLAAGQRSEA
ncbi:MAG TPA: SapC family protein [Stellaceae bacterium]|nr:SapC family protein [Stellaceae bacterium]